MRLSAKEAEKLGIKVPKQKPSVKIPKAESHLEAEMMRQLRAEGITDLVREYQFDTVREFAFDFADVANKRAFEVDGFGHNRPNRYFSDVTKGNLATSQGWAVYHITTEMVWSGEGIALIKQALGR